jgi:hypothetical protein
MSRISHILLLLIFLAFPMDSQGTSSQIILTALPQHHLPSISPIISLPILRFPSIHYPTTETSLWGPHPPLVFSTNLRHPQAKPSYTGAPVSVSALLSPHYFLILFVIKPLFPACYIAFCRHLWRPSWQTQPMSPLVGALLIIYSY